MATPRLGTYRWMVVAVALGAGCGEGWDEHEAGEAEVLDQIRAALFSNEDFESDVIGAPPSGWTVESYENLEGLTDVRPSPQTLATLNLTEGGYAATLVVGGAPESQVDPALGASASFRYPKYGNRAVRVNYLGSSTTTNGSTYNVNALRQRMTIGNSDVDTIDGRAHIRFAIAPVLQNPSHPYEEQPYYFVRLANLTRDTILYRSFNVAAQPGVPWKKVGSVYYTDWQLVDIAPGNAAMSVGDEVELLVLAAGCAQRAHWGRVYVDGFGAQVPGLHTWATGPLEANEGSDISYVVNYKNGGEQATDGTVVEMTVPPNTAFSSVSLPGACAAPSVGGTGKVICNLGALDPGASGSFTVTVTINHGATGEVTNGNYSIRATGVSALLGPKVITRINAGIPYADLSISHTNGVAAVAWGQPVTYTIRVANTGPADAPQVMVTDTLPPELGSATWTCTATGGGRCSPTGAGHIQDRLVALPVGATATYLVRATVVPGNGTALMNNVAAVAPGEGTADPDVSNNVAVDGDSIGPLRSLAMEKTGAAGGTVASSPGAIACGPTCSSASTSFLDGAEVVLNASAIAGARFAGWTGACAFAATDPTCILAMDGDKTVGAVFIPPATISVVSGSGQTAVMGTAFAAPLVARVVDPSGNPIAGATVVFAAPTRGPSALLESWAATTDDLGLVRVTAAANETGGTYQLTAGIAGSAAFTAFTLTNGELPRPLTVAAPATTVAPRGTLALAVDGGVAPHRFALRQSGSGGAVDAATGAYVAGSRGGSSDVVEVTDAAGSRASVEIAVGPGVTLSPAMGAVPPGGALVLEASGGSGSGYSFAVTANVSGGRIDAATGAYQAGPNADSTDVVTVTDSLGNTASAGIAIGAGVTVAPAAPTVPPRGGIVLGALGGSGAGYTFALTGNASGGSIDAATGAYQAGSTPSVTDQITVLDGLGNRAVVAVKVGPGVTITPETATLPAGGKLAFSVAGGSGSGFRFSLGPNGSGGDIDPATGDYQAGRTPGSTDVVTVTDGLGNAATAIVTILTPSAPILVPAGTMVIAGGRTGPAPTVSVSVPPGPEPIVDDGAGVGGGDGVDEAGGCDVTGGRGGRSTAPVLLLLAVIAWATRRRRLNRAR